MEDFLDLIGKRLVLVLTDDRTANGTETEHAAWDRNLHRGTVRAVSVIGLSAREGGDATTTSSAAGLTVSIYMQGMRHCADKILIIVKACSHYYQCFMHLT